MTKKEAIRAGRDRLVDILGKDYVMEHKDLCLMWYGHDGVITTVGLGVDEDDTPLERKIETRDTEFKRMAMVSVNRKTGIITRMK